MTAKPFVTESGRQRVSLGASFSYNIEASSRPSYNNTERENR